jgi:ABC-type sugar transport system substrate-binding protein
MRGTSTQRGVLTGMVTLLCLAALAAFGFESKSSASTRATTAKSSSSTMAAALAAYSAVPKSLVVSSSLSHRPAKKTDVYLNNGVGIAQEIGSGIQAASSALGWSYSTLSVNQNNPATITSAMLEAINHGANAVMLTATPVAIYKPALAVAKKKGVAIIDIASGNPPTSGITSLVDNSSRNGTQFGAPIALAAIQAAAKAGTNANIVLVTSPIFQTILGSTVSGAQRAVTKYCPKCTFNVFNIAANDLFGGQTASDVVSYLQSHPDTNTILEASSLTDPGLTAALGGAGLSKIRVYGGAALQPQIAEIKAGTETGWVIVPFQLEGWMAVDAAARAFTSSNPKLYNAVSIPSYLMTKANASKPSEFPNNYEATFKRMWHVS